MIFIGYNFGTKGGKFINMQKYTYFRDKQIYDKYDNL